MLVIQAWGTGGSDTTAYCVKAAKAGTKKNTEHESYSTRAFDIIFFKSAHHWSKDIH